MGLWLLFRLFVTGYTLSVANSESCQCSGFNIWGQYDGDGNLVEGSEEVMYGWSGASPYANGFPGWSGSCSYYKQDEDGNAYGLDWYNKNNNAARVDEEGADPYNNCGQCGIPGPENNPWDYWVPEESDCPPWCGRRRRRRLAHAEDAQTGTMSAQEVEEEVQAAGDEDGEIDMSVKNCCQMRSHHMGCYGVNKYAFRVMIESSWAGAVCDDTFGEAAAYAIGDLLNQVHLSYWLCEDPYKNVPTPAPSYPCYNDEQNCYPYGTTPSPIPLNITLKGVVTELTDLQVDFLNSNRLNQEDFRKSMCTLMQDGVGNNAKVYSACTRTEFLSFKAFPIDEDGYEVGTGGSNSLSKWDNIGYGVERNGYEADWQGDEEVEDGGGGQNNDGQNGNQYWEDGGDQQQDPRYGDDTMSQDAGGGVLIGFIAVMILCSLGCFIWYLKRKNTGYAYDGGGGGGGYGPVVGSQDNNMPPGPGNMYDSANRARNGRHASVESKMSAMDRQMYRGGVPPGANKMPADVAAPYCAHPGARMAGVYQNKMPAANPYPANQPAAHDDVYRGGFCCCL